MTNSAAVLWKILQGLAKKWPKLVVEWTMVTTLLVESFVMIDFNTYVKAWPILSCFFFRYYRSVMSTPKQWQRGNNLFYQHGKVWEIYSRLTIFSSNGRIPWDSSHCLECWQCRLRIGNNVFSVMEFSASVYTIFV